VESSTDNLSDGNHRKDKDGQSVAPFTASVNVGICGAVIDRLLLPITSGWNVLPGSAIQN
jgi:hypothetical protein